MNFNKLKPFTLEAAKAGEPLVYKLGSTLYKQAFIHGPDSGGKIALLNSSGKLYVETLCMAEKTHFIEPLFWFKKDPIYNGDTMYVGKKAYRVTGYNFNEKVVTLFAGGNGELIVSLYYPELSLTPKLEKKEAWLNVYSVHTAWTYPTKKEADEAASPDRKACIRIEWEE